ncbi:MULTISPECIES: hypothetical protein [Bacillus]|uniref:hypothetical protein n=1 Tax=Bacillus TaxID=1386 RepID=UPI000BB81BA3|nr:MULTISPECIES: hypothetical protein [Bacillus]
MRNWRVGTVSMGISLIVLGVMLALSQFKSWTAVEPILIWWPAILVVLGIEIILYLFSSKQENPKVKYDFLSIGFVGILGTVGIILTVFMSTGLLGEIRTLVASEERTFDLPDLQIAIGSSIDSVIIETGNQHLNIEGTNGKEIQGFGTYRTSYNDGDKELLTNSEDFWKEKKVGNTLYIYLKEPTRKIGVLSTYTSVSPTIVIPENIKLEVRGNSNNINLHVNSLQNDWTVDRAGYVDISLNAASDIQLQTVSRNEPSDSGIEWDELKGSNDGDEWSDWYSGVLKLGEGLHSLNITNTDFVFVKVK